MLTGCCNWLQAPPACQRPDGVLGRAGLYAWLVHQGGGLHIGEDVSWDVSLTGVYRFSDKILSKSERVSHADERRQVNVLCTTYNLKPSLLPFLPESWQLRPCMLTSCLYATESESSTQRQ